MRRVFVDASFLIALIWLEDRHRSRALLEFDDLAGVPLVTVSGALDELIAHSVKRNRQYRLDALAMARQVLAPGSQWTVIFPTPPLALRGLDHCEQRLQDRLSLVDSVEMTVMEDMAITEILTFDSDFAKDGRFTVLPQPITD